MPLFRHVLNILCPRVFKFPLDVTCDSETKLCHASVSMNWDLRLEMWPPVPPCSSSPGPYDISILDTASALTVVTVCSDVLSPPVRMCCGTRVCWLPAVCRLRGRPPPGARPGAAAAPIG